MAEPGKGNMSFPRLCAVHWLYAKTVLDCNRHHMKSFQSRRTNIGLYDNIADIIVDTDIFYPYQYICIDKSSTNTDIIKDYHFFFQSGN